MSLCICRSILIPIIFIFALTSILLGTLGYKNRNDINNRLIGTFCRVVSTSIRSKQCGYDCNCIHYYDHNTETHRQECQTCYRDCYDGDVLFEHIFERTAYTKLLTKQYLDSQYPINGTRKCYFEDDKPENIHHGKKKSKGFIIAAIVIGSIGGVILLVYLVAELINLC
jgi:hypothetical protein